MTDITQADIAKLKEAAEKADAGPWQVIETLHEYSLRDDHKGSLVERRIFTAWVHPQLKSPYGVVNSGHTVAKNDDGSFKTIVSISKENAAFIAHANPATILALLSENERLRNTMRQMANGWNNAVELNLIASQHRATAIVLRDNARAALGDKP